MVPLRLLGTNGTTLDVEAVLDTGFTESLTLPQALVTGLAFPRVNTDTVTLADGSIIVVDLYVGTVIWDGQARSIILHCMEGSPLIGMSLIYDCFLTMQVADGGPVSIVPIP